MLPRPAAQLKTNTSTGTFHSLVKLGLLPPGVRVSAGRTAWIESELEDVLTARAAGWSEEQIRGLVRGLLEDRKARAAELAPCVGELPDCEPARSFNQPARLARRVVAG